MTASLLIGRYRLACECGFIYSALALYDHTINRYALTGPHNEDVTHLHILYGHHDFFAVTLDCGSFGCQFHKTFQRISGLAL